MTDKYGYNLIDIVVWIMWTVFVGVVAYFIGNSIGFEEGYAMGWNDCIDSLGGLLSIGGR